MRQIIPCAVAIISLSLCGCGSDRSTAAGTTPASATPVAAPASGDQAQSAAPAPAATATGTELPKAINTIDPVDGLPVDTSIPPISVDIAVISPPLTVVVGVSSAENAKKVQADPDKYAGAAVHNRVARQETDTLLPH